MALFDTTDDPGNAALDQKSTAMGIVLFLAATFLIVTMNAFAKMASAYHTPVEIVFYRGLVAMAMLLAYVLATRRKDVFKTTRPYTHLGRSIVGNCGVILVYWSYSLMPMADVTAFLFTSPLMVTVLSVPLLGEKVGPYRWAAVMTGLIGVMMITQPFGGSFIGAKALIPLGATFFTALVNIFLRTLGKTEDPFTTVFYFLAAGLTITGLYMPFFGHPPHPEAVMALIGTGITSGLQLILKTQAYRLAEASLLSPFAYSSIVWATLFGWLFWGELPTIWVVCGAAVIIASNMTIYYREQYKKRRAASTP